MPASPIPIPVLIISFSTQLTEGTAYNKLYYTVTGTIATGSVLQGLLDTFCDPFYTLLGACVSAECIVAGGYARYITSTSDLEAYSGIDAVAGSIAGDALPIQDCFEIRRLTGKPGRDARGRLFFSGISEDDVQYGKIKEVRFTALEALSTKLVANIVEGDITAKPVLWSRKLSVLYPITSGVTVGRMVSRRDRAKKEKYVPIGV